MTILVISALLVGCHGGTPTTTTPATTTTTTTTTPNSQWQISHSKYVFIEHHISVHGELIEGKYPFLYIDFPRYGFDENTGTLYAGGGYSKLDLEVDETLKVVYGYGQDLSGCAGSGIATGLQGVYELPYESDKLIIVEIGSDGTAHLEYNNVSIVLKSGEKWSNAESTIETKQSDGKTAKARITTTDTIMNYGILDKSKIG